MHFDLKYGNGTLPLDLADGNIIDVVLPGKNSPISDPEAAVNAILQKPYGTPPLLDMLRKAKPKKLVIVVNDITRPTPYALLMPPLLRVIGEAGISDSDITLLTATGIHDPHTE